MWDTKLKKRKLWRVFECWKPDAVLFKFISLYEGKTSPAYYERMRRSDGKTQLAHYITGDVYRITIDAYRITIAVVSVH